VLSAEGGAAGGTDGGEGGGEGGGGGRTAGRVAASMTSVATDLPAAATPDSTPMALFSNPIVSAIVLADTRPARRLSSTPSAKRWKTLGDCAVFSA
jgi:hypothetical protein